MWLVTITSHLKVTVVTCYFSLKLSAACLWSRLFFAGNLIWKLIIWLFKIIVRLCFDFRKNRNFNVDLKNRYSTNSYCWPLGGFHIDRSQWPWQFSDRFFFYWIFVVFYYGTLAGRSFCSCMAKEIINAVLCNHRKILKWKLETWPCSWNGSSTCKRDYAETPSMFLWLCA